MTRRRLEGFIRRRRLKGGRGGSEMLRISHFSLASRAFLPPHRFFFEPQHYRNSPMMALITTIVTTA